MLLTDSIPQSSRANSVHLLFLFSKKAVTDSDRSRLVGCENNKLNTQSNQTNKERNDEIFSHSLRLHHLELSFSL